MKIYYENDLESYVRELKDFATMVNEIFTKLVPKELSTEELKVFKKELNKINKFIDKNSEEIWRIAYSNKINH